MATYDSWEYLSGAFGGRFIGLTWARPAGYPAFIHAVSFAGPTVWAVVVVQMTITVAVGVLIYALLGSLRLPRWLRTALPAVLLLDGGWLALDDFVFSDTLFMALAVAGAILCGAGRRWRTWAAGGVVLAAAVLVRPIGLALLPVLALVGLVRRVGPRPIIGFAVAVSVPILAYSGYHERRTGVFGLAQMDGWYLYGRVGPMIQCSATDLQGADAGLCRRLPGVTDPPPYIYSPESPAWAVVGPLPRLTNKQELRADRRLRHFALHMIEEHPGQYVRLVAGTLRRQVLSGLKWELPASDRDISIDESVRSRYVPDYKLKITSAGGVVRDYTRLIQVPSWGYLLFAVLAAVALSRRVRRGGARSLGWTCVASAAALVVAADALAGYDARYLMVTLPLLLIAVGCAFAPAAVTNEGPANVERAERSAGLPSNQ